MGLEVGKLVRCIRGIARTRSTDPFSQDEISTPQRGQVYTIREVVRTNHGTGLRLEEIINREYYHAQGGWQEPCFDTRRFVVIGDEDEAAKATAALLGRIRNHKVTQHELADVS